MEAREVELSFRVLCVGAVFDSLAEHVNDEMSLHFAAGAFEALGLLRCDTFDAVIARAPIPGCSTPETMLDEIQRVSRSARVILYDPFVSMRRAVELTRRGAFDIAETEERLVQAVERCAASTPPSVAAESWRRHLIGHSPRMQQVAEIIRLVANRKCTVLITGETGTGKEMVARAIHQASNRSQHALVSINCSAVPEALLEAELFGHVKGAFTGAISTRIGRFEQAHRGTLFLDEIGEMPASLQAKLLRVLQEREFERLGSAESVRVDTRVIAATNVNVVDRVRDGRFREDLYYRLNVVPIALPALRERTDDIPLLAQHFVEKVCRQEALAPKYLSPAVMDRLCGHDWPGNVRQLENAIEMAVALSGERRELSPGDFALPSRVAPPRLNTDLQPFLAVPEQGLDFERTVGSIERHLLEQALTKTHGNKKAAAQMLRLKRTTLSAKLKTLSAVAAAAG